MQWQLGQFASCQHLMRMSLSITNNQLPVTKNLLGDGMASNYVNECDQNWGFIDKETNLIWATDEPLDPALDGIISQAIGPVCILPPPINEEEELNW